MKKLIALLLVLVMALGMVACTAADDATQTTPPAGDQDATETTAAQEATDKDYVLENGKLVVGITEYAPMDYKDENGEWTGFDAELARMFADELGVQCEFFVIADWSKKFIELETKNIDVIWNGMTITEEVTLNTNCSDPYVLNAQVVVMKEDRIADYADTASMSGLTVAVENGSAGQTAAEEIEGVTTVAVADQAAALMEVAAGTSDACIIDITMANAMTGEGTDYENLAQGLTLNEEKYGVGFRKGSNLTELFNQFLEEKEIDGTLEQLAKKYDLTLAE